MARKLVQSNLFDVELSLRGFGLKVGPTTPKRFADRIAALVVGHATLTVVAEALLAVHAALLRELDGLERLREAGAKDRREDARVRLLMSTPDVGVIVALTYGAAIDDPGRFRQLRAVVPCDRCHWG